MSLENSIDKSLIIGVPSGEVLFVDTPEKLRKLRDFKLIWIRVMPDFTFASVFSDFDLKKVKHILNQ